VVGLHLTGVVVTTPNAPSVREALEVAIASCPRDAPVVDHVLDSLKQAGFTVAREGVHLLHQEEDTWAMEHTLSCRERGLVRCELNALACAGAWHDLGPGVYLVSRGPAGEPLAEEWPA
jgi:hypothetical protein